MALDLSLKTGQWPERTNSVITSTHSPYHEIRTKSYQLQQNHHQLLETEKLSLSYYNNLSTIEPGPAVPISLVITKNRQNHTHASATIPPTSSSSSSHLRNHRHDRRDHNHHHLQFILPAADTRVIKANGYPIFNNANSSRRSPHNNGFGHVKVNSSPIHVDDGEPGELLIVEEHNHSRSRSRSPVPRPVSLPAYPTPPDSRGLKRILVEDDTSTSQLSFSTFAHSNNNHMRRHPKKANIFLHQEELKQLMNNNVNNSHTSNNHNHDIRFAASSSPTRTSTTTTTKSNDHHPPQFQIVDEGSNSNNNVTSVQPCDSSSSVVAARNNLITSSTSPPTSTPNQPNSNPHPPTVAAVAATSNGAVDKNKKIEAKFTCTHCTKNFKKQSLLDAHMRLMQEKAKWKSFQKKKYIKTTNPISTPNGSTTPVNTSPTRTDSTNSNPPILPSTTNESK